MLRADLTTLDLSPKIAALKGKIDYVMGAGYPLDKVVSSSGRLKADCSGLLLALWGAVGLIDLLGGFPRHSSRSLYDGVNRVGAQISPAGPFQFGDFSIYGDGQLPESDGDAAAVHVAVCVGGGRWASHGQQGGPYLYDTPSYRSDLIAVARPTPALISYLSTSVPF